MIVLCIGRRERGKTTLAYYQASKVKRLFVFDPRGMIQRPGSARVKRAAELRDVAFPALMDNEIREVIYQPQEDDIQAAFATFSRLAKRWITELPDEPLAVMVDEISFVNLNEPAFQWVLKCCASDRVHIFLTCHRPADVPVNVRSIADRWCLFQCRQEHDMTVIEERCSPEVAQAVRRVEGHQFVMWDDAKAEVRIFRDSEKWHVKLKDGRTVQAPVDMDEVPSEDGKNRLTGLPFPKI
jgi:hypothetical protein